MDGVDALLVPPSLIPLESGKKVKTDLPVRGRQVVGAAQADPAAPYLLRSQSNPGTRSSSDYNAHSVTNSDLQSLKSAECVWSAHPVTKPGLQSPANYPLCRQ